VRTPRGTGGAGRTTGHRDRRIVVVEGEARRGAACAPIDGPADEFVIIPNRNYTAAEVARMLRLAPETFRDHRKKMIRDEGFPRPISNTYYAPWYGQDLIDWLRRDKTPELTAMPGNVTDITSRLAARARAIAGAKR
jgi:hypothetical protein